MGPDDFSENCQRRCEQRYLRKRSGHQYSAAPSLPPPYNQYEEVVASLGYTQDSLHCALRRPRITRPSKCPLHQDWEDGLEQYQLHWYKVLLIRPNARARCGRHP